MKGILSKCRVLPLAVLLVSPAANAFQFDTGSSDWKVRWDNTIRYSNLYRLQDPNTSFLAPAVLAPPAVLGGSGGTGAGDGNRNFDKGFASHRFDLLTELDVIWKRKAGLRFSADAWYDTEYHGSNDNDTGFTHNVTVPANKFSDGVEETMGEDVRILDAFGFYKGKLSSVPYRLNVGRHVVIYGETLIGGNNGIAAANGPVDIIKAATVPGAKIKEFLLPSWQISGSVRPLSNLTLGGYYQFKWEESAFFAPGSFLSPNDIYGKDAEALFSTPVGGLFTKGADLTPEDDGQWGAQVRYRPDFFDVELGAYAVNWHDKVMTAAYFDPAVTGTYRRVFHEDIRAYGLSASTTIGKHSVSLEASYRENMPLVGGNAFIQTVIPNNAGLFDNKSNPAYPVGETFHTTLVAINTIQPNWLMDGGSYVIQWDFHKVLNVAKNNAAIDPATTTSANQLVFILEPEYYNVLDGLDLTIPMVVNYQNGRSRVFTGWINGGGSFDIGVKGTYLSVWEMRFNYRNHFGNKGLSIGSFPVGGGTFDQTLYDRDFLSFTVGRTF